MYISAERSENIQNRYFVTTLLCAVFAAVYEAFSHGVLSRWMLALPLYPLFSTLVFHILHRLNKPVGSWFRSLWLCGITTQAVCSCLRGVFDIYGTEFPFFWMLWGMGNLLIILAQFFQRRALRS